MAFVIAEPCRKNSACVDVCPVDCIHPRRDEPQYASVEMSFIEDLPEPWKHYAEINAKHYEKHGSEYVLSAKQHHP
jgi:ferredoxin